MLRYLFKKFNHFPAFFFSKIGQITIIYYYNHNTPKNVEKSEVIVTHAIWFENPYHGNNKMPFNKVASADEIAKMINAKISF